MLLRDTVLRPNASYELTLRPKTNGTSSEIAEVGIHDYC